MSHIYDYPRPCVTCDNVIFDLYDDDKIPKLLLVLRKNEPFKGMWALPGGFLNEDEELEECAARELAEETGVDLDADHLNQVLTVGRKGRDPRARIISVVYTAVVDRYEHPICADDDAEEVAWFPMDELPSLAADHLEIVRKILGKVYHDVG
ncbi:MAG: NUDIX hydrolase [Nitrososphaerales archaeon]